MKPGEVVVMGAFGRVSEHQFLAQLDEEVGATGATFTGPLVRASGEPYRSITFKVLRPDGARQGT